MRRCDLDPARTNRIRCPAGVEFASLKILKKGKACFCYPWVSIRLILLQVGEAIII